jgi:hypothetical protein
MEFILGSALFPGFGVSNTERGQDVEEQAQMARDERGMDRNCVFCPGWLALRPHLLAARLSGAGRLRNPPLGIVHAGKQPTWEFL